MLFHRYIVSLSFLLLYFGCVPSDSNEAVTATNAASPSASEALFAQQFPRLAPIIDSDTTTQRVVTEYALKVLQGDANNDTVLEQILNERAIVMAMLHQKVLNPFLSKNDTYYNSEDGEGLETELNRIGIKTAAAEGIYIDLVAAPLMTANFRKYANEPLFLYQQFITASASSVGGEYPYTNLKPEMEMVIIGEKMLQQYPNHRYTQQIASEFRYALRVLTDLHTVKSPVSGVYYVVSDLLFQPYPTATDVAQYGEFVQKNPKSKYSALIDKIYEQPSEIRLNADEIPEAVYLVVVAWQVIDDDQQSCNQLDQQRNKYLDQGIDIPHLISIQKDNQKQCALTYRFFADIKKAQNALQSIQKRLKRNDIYLYKAIFRAETQTWSIE